MDGPHRKTSLRPAHHGRVAHLAPPQRLPSDEAAPPLGRGSPHRADGKEPALGSGHSHSHHPEPVAVSRGARLALLVLLVLAAAATVFGLVRL